LLSKLRRVFEKSLSRNFWGIAVPLHLNYDSRSLMPFSAPLIVL